jgi:hypothetical protein
VKFKLSALLALAFAHTAYALPEGFKVYKSPHSMTSEVLVKLNSESKVPLSSADKFRIKFKGNLDELQEAAANIIYKCNADFKCFESLVKRDNPKVRYMSYDNKINIAHQFSVRSSYFMIFERVTLIGMKTLDGKIISFGVNSGVIAM